MWLQEPYGAQLDHQVYHIFREANGYMDALARRGNQQQCLLETYGTCSTFVFTTFVWDMEHIGTTRMCNIKVVMPTIVWHYI